MQHERLSPRITFSDERLLTTSDVNRCSSPGIQPTSASFSARGISPIPFLSYSPYSSLSSSALVTKQSAKSAASTKPHALHDYKPHLVSHRHFIYLKKEQVVHVMESWECDAVPMSNCTLKQEHILNLRHKESDGGVTESSSLLRLGTQREKVERSSEMIKAALYAVQVFYSFFIM
jgi:hypothetical protein